MSKIHNARELEKAAKRANCRIENGGNHPHIVTPSGCAVPYPRHPGDMNPNLIKKIEKELALVGIILSCFIGACLLDPVFGYAVWTALFGS
jgi:hypothetical protein